MLGNEPRANQHAAIAAAFAAFTLGAIVVTSSAAVAFRQLPQPVSSEEADDLLGDVGITWLGWLILSVVLAFTYARRPDPDRYTRPIPPLGFLLPAALGGAAIGISESTNWNSVHAGLYWGTGSLCWVWTACIVVLTEENDDHELL